MKNFIKNNLKVFVTMIITTIIVGSVSVYAASQYFAKDITFTPTNENFKKENGEPIDNVEDALNELYARKNDHIEKGKINVSFPYNNWIYMSFTFDKKYTEIPKIYYEYNGGKSGGTIYISNVTLEGFEIGLNNFFSTAREDTINWVAIGK